MFSCEFVPESDDCTTNSSQIRESCSGDWLLATTYILWVIQEQAWVWIINATKQCKCDAAPIACKVFCKEINPRHLRIFSPVNCKWKLTGEIMEEFSKKCLMINCLFRFRKQIRDSNIISLCYFPKAQKTFNFVISSSDFESCTKFNLQWRIGWLQLRICCRLYLKTCSEKRNCTVSKLDVSH